MSWLLIPSKPLLVLPELATRIGLDEAIALQQIHYRIANHQEQENQLFFKNGRWWVSLSEKEWQEKQFPWWSLPTISRIFKTLEKMKLIEIGYFTNGQGNRRKWYTIDYPAVKATESLPITIRQESREGRIQAVLGVVQPTQIRSDQNDRMRCDQNDQISQIRSDQNDRMRCDQNDRISQIRSDQNDRIVYIQEDLDNLVLQVDINTLESLEKDLLNQSPNGLRARLPSTSKPKDEKSASDPSSQSPATTDSAVESQGRSSETDSSGNSLKNKKSESLRAKRRRERKEKYLEPGTGTYSVPARPKWRSEAFESWFRRYGQLTRMVRLTAKVDRTEAAIAWGMMPEAFVPNDFATEEELLEVFERKSLLFEKKISTAFARGENCLPVPDAERFLLGKANGGNPYWWTDEGVELLAVKHYPQEFQQFFSDYKTFCQTIGADVGSVERAMVAWDSYFEQDKSLERFRDGWIAYSRNKLQVFARKQSVVGVSGAAVFISENKAERTLEEMVKREQGMLPTQVALRSATRQDEIRRAREQYEAETTADWQGVVNA